ncbi:MAG: Hpt domain-containing protein [Nitrospinae bacterium]|nr:Hpt domain-containing protein [Nitrospinota bacterium]
MGVSGGVIQKLFCLPTLHQANKKIAYAWIAALANAFLILLGTMVMVSEQGLSSPIQRNLILMSIFALAAYRIYQKSRAAAVILFLFYLLDKSFLWWTDWPEKIGNVPIGFLLGILFLYCFIEGMRGTFSYHWLNATKNSKFAEHREPLQAGAPGTPESLSGQMREEGPTAEEDMTTPHCPENSVVDLAVLEEWRTLSGHGQLDSLSQTLQQLVQDVSAHVEEVQRAVETNDGPALARVAHGLKGICGNMGATAMAERAFSLEQQALSTTLEGAKTQLPLLRNDFHKVRLALEQELVKAH